MPCSICGRPAAPGTDICDECARPLSLPAAGPAPVIVPAIPAQETVFDPAGGSPPPAAAASPPQPVSRSSAGRIAALALLALLIVAAGAAGTYFLLVRDNGSEPSRAQTPATEKADGGGDPRLGESGGSGSPGGTTTDTGSGSAGGTTTDGSGDGTTTDRSAGDTTTAGTTTDGGSDGSSGGTTTGPGGGSAASGSSGSGSGPEGAVRQHFSDIDDGAYATAWSLLSTRYRNQNPRASWVADKESNAARIAVQAANFKRYIGGSRAQVFLDVVTRDAGASRCTRFSGKVIVVKEGGRWLYDPNRPDLGGTWSKRGTLSDSDPRCGAL